MGYGRKDYFWGVAPEKSTFGELQNPFVHTGSNIIAGSGSGTIMTYNVPAGYNAEINGIMVTCNIPGMMYFELKVVAVSKLLAYFDMQRDIYFGESGCIEAVSEDAVIINFTNVDSAEGVFTANIFGFLHQIVT